MNPTWRHRVGFWMGRIVAAVFFEVGTFGIGHRSFRLAKQAFDQAYQPGLSDNGFDWLVRLNVIFWHVSKNTDFYLRRLHSLQLTNTFIYSNRIHRVLGGSLSKESSGMRVSFIVRPARTSTCKVPKIRRWRFGWVVCSCFFPIKKWNRSAPFFFFLGGGNNLFK